MSNFAYIDFEFNHTTEKKLNVVCCSVLVDGKINNFWTHNTDSYDLNLFLTKLCKTHFLVGYATEAEASAIYSLGLNPLMFKWIDLHLEVKMLYNHNHALTTGKHLVDGKEKYLRPFSEKPSTSMASSLYKFCNIMIDTEHKTQMRDILISKDKELIEKHKEGIMSYCASDVKYLPALFQAIQENQNKYIPLKYRNSLPKEMIGRGEYSARTALMVRHGIPINIDWARNLSANIPLLLTDCIQDINSQFDPKPFKFDKKTARYVLDTKAVRDWISKSGIKDWKLTDGGTKGKREFSLALEAFEDHFSFRHEFPRNNLGAQMMRYLKMKQSLNSFNFKQGQKESTFFDYIGKDNFSRPFFNHFGAQSSRSQPKSSSFLFLKSAFMRVLCQPPVGYAIGAIDYSSQEFLLSAVCSMDKKMIQAYKEGDVYLYYGKGIGLIPPEGTKATHGKERDLCKSTVLGLSYLMTKVGLSKKLTADTGRYVSEEEADDLVNKFDDLFDTFSRWRESVISHYEIERILRLPDGWTMFGNNPSFRSAANMPLQGAGASIMRKAVALAQDSGLTIIQTLHDALYIMSPSDRIYDDMDKLKECMTEAFCFYFNEQQKEAAKLIRCDGKIWGPELEEGQMITKKGFKLESSIYHIDGRGKSEYNRYEKYFKESPNLEML
jgi:hypothetical protein